jgi:hypothetical protein
LKAFHLGLGVRAGCGHRRQGLIHGNRRLLLYTEADVVTSSLAATVDVRLIPRADVASSASYDAKATLTNDDRTLARMTVATALSKRFTSPQLAGYANIMRLATLAVRFD